MARQQPPTDRSRRRFLKQIGGAAIGAITLSACSRDPVDLLSRDRASATPLPAGYRFFPIQPGDASGLPPGVQLSPLVMLNETGTLLFYAVVGERYGLFSMDLGLGGGAPAVRSSRTILLTGSTLRDGRRIDSIDTVDLNDHGSIAVVLGTDGEIRTDRLALMGPGLYLSRERGDFEPLVSLGDAVPDGAGMFGGVFGDLTLNNRDNVLFAGMYAERGAGAVAAGDTVFSGLFHLPSASLRDGRGVVNSTTMLRGTDHGIVQFGLVDMAESGEFAAQVFAANADRSLEAIMLGTAAPPTGSHVISGSVTSARSAIDLARPAAAGGRADGTVYFGPRVAGDGRQAVVVHYSDDDAALYFGDALIARTGTPSPLENTIRGLSAPVAGPDGLLFYLLALDESGFELCVTNGDARATILASGNQVAGRTVTTAMLGYHSDQCDSEARIAFYAEFDDGSSAMLVGIPV